MCYMNLQWNMDWIELKIAEKVIADNDVLQGILDDIEDITPEIASNRASGSFYQIPEFITDEGKNRYTGWNDTLGELKQRWNNKGKPPLKIQATHVSVAYLHYDTSQNPSVEDDKDMQIDVKIRLPFSEIRGIGFHRRICTTNP